MKDLKSFIEERRAAHERIIRHKECYNPSPFKEEALIWAIQDYYSSKREFTAADKKTLEEYGFFESDFTEGV